ncbi:MAG: contractile injection system tape measure protein, partial [Terracidiphilus sp.]
MAAAILDELDGARPDSGGDPDAKPEGRQRWLTALRNNSVLRARLVAELPPERLPAILRVWIPDYSSAVVEFAALLCRMHRRFSLVPADHVAFERQLWRCILDEAAECRTGSFSLRTLLGRMVVRLARYHSLPSRDLGSRISAGWKRCAESTPLSHELLAVLPSFDADAASDSGSALPDDPLQTASWKAIREATESLPESEAEAVSLRTPSASLGNLARFLEWGILPWSGHSAWGSAESEMLSNLASAPDQVCILIRSLGEAEPVRKRIAGQFSEAVVHRLIGELDPVNASWMLLLTKQLRLLHRQKPLIPLQNSAFSQLLSEVTLEYLSERHWHALDAVSFLRFLLRRLAYRQKVGYEILLADLALRRSPDPDRAQSTGEIDPQSQLSATIVTLLETDLLGIRNRLAQAPRFTVRPEFRDRYCDRDVLAYWIRWRKLPAWSFDDRPRETVETLRPMLDVLPLDCAVGVRMTKDDSGRTEAPPDILSTMMQEMTPALEIERWLLFGLWPREVDAPQDAAHESWLRDRSDADWLQALKQCGAQDQAIRRIARLSPESVLRVAGLLSGPNSAPVHEFLLALHSIGRPLEGSFPPPWEEHVNRYALAHLLEDGPANGRSATFLPHLAHDTLFALSLSFQIPYDRLLFLLRRECSGPSSLQNLCAALEDELESGQELEVFDFGSISGSDAIDMVKVEPSEIARAYMLDGRLPAGAQHLEFATLRRIARRLTDSELVSITEVRGGGAGQRGEILSRAERLLPPASLERLKQIWQSGDRESSAKTDERQSGQPREKLQPLRQTEPAAQTIPEPRHLESTVRSALGDDSSEETAHVLARLDAFTFFLRSGELPWWADRELSVPSNRWLQPLLQLAPGRLLRTLRSAATSPTSIERLLRNVPRTSLAELIRHVEPDLGDTMVHYLYAGEELAHDAGLTASERTNAPAVHWRAALELLLDAHQPRRSSADTLNYLSARISQQLNMSAARYLASVVKVAQDRAERGIGPAALVETLLQLLRNAAPAGIEAEADRDRQAAQNERPASTLTQSEDEPAAANRSASDPSWNFPQLYGRDGARQEVPEPASRKPNHEVLGASILPSSEPDRTPASRSRSNDQTAAHKAKISSGETSAVATKGWHTAEEMVDGTAVEDGFLPDPTTEIGQLEHLLRFGALPEPSRAALPEEFITSLAERIRCHPERYRKLIQRAAESAIERQRMVKHFSAEALNEVWKLLLHKEDDLARLCMEEIDAAACMASTPTRHEEVHRVCGEELLGTSAISAERPWEISTYFGRVLQRLSKEHGQQAAETIANLRMRFSRQSEPLRTRLATALVRAERETAGLPVWQRSVHEASRPTPPPVRRPQKRATPFPVGEPFYIANAGAILLWPFLGRYFQTLGLMEKNRFLDEPTRSRAIYLVQFLATGIAEAPEQALLLNKILCGAQPEQPVDAAPTVTGEEAALSTQLLQGVIANWAKLGSTSIEGLRQSFFLRDGRLIRSTADDSWE